MCSNYVVPQMKSLVSVILWGEGCCIYTLATCCRMWALAAMLPTNQNSAFVLYQIWWITQTIDSILWLFFLPRRPHAELDVTSGIFLLVIYWCKHPISDTCEYWLFSVCMIHYKEMYFEVLYEILRSKAFLTLALSFHKINIWVYVFR